MSQVGLGDGFNGEDQFGFYDVKENMGIDDGINDVVETENDVSEDDANEGSDVSKDVAAPKGEPIIINGCWI